MSYEEVLAQARKKFFEKYPDCPVSEPVKCLNLIMKREFAEAIVRGEKKVEYRAYSKHYADRLYDKDILEYGTKIEEADLDDYTDFARPIRVVEKIHFHPYNNSWWLDVECVANDIAAPCKVDVDFLEEQFGDTELKGMQQEFDRQKGETNRPIFFYFAIGKILDTNLK